LLAPSAFADVDTWVSGVGDDANACTRTAPCKTFAGTIASTDAGGTIHVLDSGGFGAITITKAVTIDGGSFQASALSAGTNGIVIAAGAGDDVTLRNLVVSGAGTTTSGCRYTSGVRGIVVRSAHTVHLDHVRVQQYINGGLRIENTANAVAVDANTLTVRNICGPGIDVAPSGTGTASVALRDASVSRATTGVSVTSGGAVSLLDSTIFGNDTGVLTTGTGTIYADALTQIIANTTDGTPTSVGLPLVGLAGAKGDAGADGLLLTKLLVRTRAVQLNARAGRMVRIDFLSTTAASADLTITRGGVPVARLHTAAATGQNTFVWSGRIGKRRAGTGTYGYQLSAVNAGGQVDAMTGTLNLTR
jgi:hypothetical protein